MELTLGIIKPDAVRANNIGAVIDMVEQAGLMIVGMKMLHLTKGQAQGFYYVHRERPFYDSLTDFMSSGPCVVMCLAGDDAITRWRTAMGATNPEEAAEGTIRKKFATNVEQNAVHGSDAPETAAFEIGFFFNVLEIAR